MGDVSGGNDRATRVVSLQGLLVGRAVVPRWIVAAVAGACLLTSCASAGSTTPSPSGVAFQITIGNAISEAKVGGASDAQLTILERSLHSSEVSLEDASEAAQNTVDCLVQTGLNASTQNQVELTSMTSQL